MWRKCYDFIDIVLTDRYVVHYNTNTDTYL